MLAQFATKLPTSFAKSQVIFASKLLNLPFEMVVDTLKVSQCHTCFLIFRVRTFYWQVACLDYQYSLEHLLLQENGRQAFEPFGGVVPFTNQVCRLRSSFSLLAIQYFRSWC